MRSKERCHLHNIKAQGKVVSTNAETAARNTEDVAKIVKCLH